VSNYGATNIFFLASLVLSSCSAAQYLQPIPALLVKPSAESRLALEHALGDLFNSQPIKLADTIFIHKSTVIIEPRQPKDSRANELDGRETRQANTVSLLIEDDKCYVRHDQSGQIRLVDGISCKAI
tara:strand:- start:6670 stop:7050 length:381 start_codon:yes stop_codon:yes gene_type:complete